MVQKMFRLRAFRLNVARRDLGGVQTCIRISNREQCRKVGESKKCLTECMISVLTEVKAPTKSFLGLFPSGKKFSPKRLDSVL